ncbi:MAG: hypothetical protein WC956_07970 [bacterium]
MGNPGLKPEIITALNRYYLSSIVEQIERDSGNAQDASEELRELGHSFERLANEFSTSPATSAQFLRTLITGEADPAAVYAGYRMLVRGKSNTTTLVPHRPYTEVLATQKGRVVQCLPTSIPAVFRTPRGTENLPVAAIVTTPTRKQGLPLLAEINRILIDGKLAPITVASLPVGDLRIRKSGPFSCVITDRNDQVVGRLALVDQYVEAVAGIKREEDLVDTFFMLMETALRHTAGTIRGIQVMVARAMQHDNAYQGTLVDDITLKGIQELLYPLELRAGAAHRAFMSHPLSETVDGSLIADQVRALNRVMRGIVEITVAPLPSRIENDHDNALAVTYSAMQFALGIEGLGSLFDLGRHIHSAYSDSATIGKSGLDVEIRSDVPFTSFAPHATRALVHTIFSSTIRERLASDDGKQRLGIKFSLDEGRHTATVTFGRPRSPDLKRRLEEIAHKTGFDGELAFDEGLGGIRDVILVPPAVKPFDGGRTSGAPTTERTPGISPSVRAAFTTIPSAPLNEAADSASLPRDTCAVESGILPHEGHDTDISGISELGFERGDTIPDFMPIFVSGTIGVK